MSNNLFEFNHQIDLQEKENSYAISDVQHIYINDINQIIIQMGTLISQM